MFKDYFIYFQSGFRTHTYNLCYSLENFSQKTAVCHDIVKILVEKNCSNSSQIIWSLVISRKTTSIISILFIFRWSKCYASPGSCANMFPAKIQMALTQIFFYLLLIFITQRLEMFDVVGRFRMLLAEEAREVVPVGYFTIEHWWLNHYGKA